MVRKRHSPQLIAAVLRRVETGITLEEAAPKAALDGLSLAAVSTSDDRGHRTRECLALEVAPGFRASTVVDALSRVVQHRGAPAAIRCDQGTEFTAEALDQWAYGNRSSSPSRGRERRRTTRSSSRSMQGCAKSFSTRGGLKAYIKPVRRRSWR